MLSAADVAECERLEVSSFVIGRQGEGPLLRNRGYKFTM